MRRRFQIGLTFIGLSLLVSAQSTPVIMTIDSNPVTKAEFEAIYKKNNRDSVITDAALDEYVELFINYKLKVAEAERLRLDTVSEFKSELAGYRRQLARPYLVDNKMTDELLQEAYDRLKMEVDASHILKNIPADASPADTLAVYKEISQIKKDIEGGSITFEEAAAKHSDDPSAKSNKGRLGYFTSMQMVYPFENAAYRTEIGQVSDIVRTRFGYHILKVHDKRDSRGEITVSHIMVKSKKDDSEEARSKAEQKIKDIYAELKDGAGFGDLAMKYSDDKQSARNRGELPKFGTGKMVKEFEDASFGLGSDGDISEPFLTEYGWHIVQRLSYEPLAPFEEKERELKSRISRDVRSQLSARSFVNKVKREYGFKEKVKSLEPIRAMVDTSILGGQWRPGDTDKYTKWLFKIGKTKYTQAQFIEFLKKSQGRTNEQNLRKYVDDRYELFKTRELTNYEDARLEGKYPEFKALMKEYRDGILLFELTDQKVWSKAVEDTLGLEAYYEANKDEYMYQERVNGPVYRAKTQEVADRVREMLEDGQSNDAIEKEVNKESQLELTIISSILEKDENEMTQQMEFKKGLSEVFFIDGQYVFMDVQEVLAPDNKPFDKVKGLVTAGYQNQLEAEWLDELRARYTVTVDKDVLYSVR